jgi:GDP-L-fucose synthase
MKILITGSDGVIGRFLSKKLKDHEVYTPKRRAVDLTNRDHVNKFFNSHDRFDLVLHCAIVGGNRMYNDGWDVLDSNLRMYYNILENKNSFNKFINFASGAELYIPNSPYGLSKKAISSSVQDQFNFYNIRIFGLFGEGELETRFIRASLENYKNKRPIEIHQNKIMDFFYIDDLWKLVKYYIDNQFPEKEINGSYKQSNGIDLLSIANMINLLDNHTVDIIIKDKEYGNPYVGNPCKLDLNYIGLERGLQIEYKKL